MIHVATSVREWRFGSGAPGYSLTLVATDRSRPGAERVSVSDRTTGGSGFATR